MKRVLLIDADSTIPNIPLMKISTWHKLKGDEVELKQLHLPYYPGRKKLDYMVPPGYDRVYCSVIFDGNKKYITGNGLIFNTDIIWGGTGYDLKTVLPLEIEQCELDYSLYPGNDISYGFITRGCIRKCKFCKVPEKEGHIRKVAEIGDIVKHKKVKFLDNNILAYPGHLDILSELIDKKIKCQFNQGLDIRLVTKENSKLLSKLNYLGEYIFAFDDWKYKNVIEKKLRLLNWRKDWQFKFFVYAHPDIPISDTINRMLWLRDHKCVPYIMRHIDCWKEKNTKFYIDMASYCNQVHLFKKMSFLEYSNRRHNRHGYSSLPLDQKQQFYFLPITSLSPIKSSEILADEDGKYHQQSSCLDRQFRVEAE